MDTLLKEVKEMYTCRRNPIPSLGLTDCCDRCRNYYKKFNPMNLCSECLDQLKEGWPEVYEELKIENMRRWDENG